jgi:hypothetical protein
MILTAVYQILINHQPLVDLVGDRIEPGVIEQGSPLPALDMRSITRGDGKQHLSGGIQLFEHEVIFDCYGRTAIEANRVAYAIMRSPLLGYRGSVGDVFVSGVIAEDLPTDSIEGADPGSDARRYVSSCSVLAAWNFTT